MSAIWAASGSCAERCSQQFNERSSSPERRNGRPDRTSIEAQHGVHLDWREIPAGQDTNYAEIVLNTRPRAGAEPLIEFPPDGKIRYTYFVY